MQMTFSEMNRHLVMDEVLKNKKTAVPENNAVSFVKGKSTIIAKLASQSAGNKLESEKLMTACLEQFYATLKNYRLRDNSLADGMALCAIINYNTYNNLQSIDETGLKITSRQLEKTFQDNKNLAAQSNQQKQESLEQLAIGSIIAQMAIGRDNEKAKAIAAGIFKNILNIAVTDISFGSNGFFIVNGQSQTLASVSTVFNRSNTCYSCIDFAMKNPTGSNGQKLSADYFKNLLAEFDKLLAQKGKKRNDIADMLTECFVICYNIEKQGYKLSDKQIGSVRKIILENLSNDYNEFKAKGDQQKQLMYEEYVISTMHAQYQYHYGKKQTEEFNRKVAQNNPNDVDVNFYSAMSRAYSTTPDNSAVGVASTLIVKMLKPVSLYDYILTDDGFIKK